MVALQRYRNDPEPRGRRPGGKENRGRAPGRPGIRRRGTFLAVLALCAFSGYLVFSLVRIQVVEHEAYALEAAKLHYRLIQENPVRGAIVDRNGLALAVSSVTETVGMTPASVHGHYEDAEGKSVPLTRLELAQGIAQALSLDVDEVRWLFTGRPPADGVEPEKIGASKASYVLLKKRIPTNESEALEAFMEANSVEGIRIDREVKRYYPDGNLAPQVVGFSSAAGEGLLGLELQYDDALSGSPGFTYVETDGYYGDAGLPFSVPTSLRAKDGLTLHTTLDARIQRIASEELRQAVDLYQVERGGVVIVMDPYTGDVLAMASCPDFDANDPKARPAGWTQAEWDPDGKSELTALQSLYWRNLAISNTYEPGSTFKAITAAAAFEEGVATERQLFSDAPNTEFPEWTISCWIQKTGKNHGTERLEQGFWNSCNPVFVQVAKLVGLDRFYGYVKAFGFETVTGIDLPGEAPGIFHATPKTIDFYSLSFGEQSNVTPIALLTAYNAFANGGSIVRPRLAASLTDASGKVVREIPVDAERRVVSESTAARIRAMMRGVVLYGTGSPAYIEGYDVAGKTSTSNTATEKVVSFCAMAPADQPVLTVLVVLNAPSSKTSSTAASTLAAKVLSQGLEALGVERTYTDRDRSVLMARKAAPDFRGLTLRDARKKAVSFGLTLVPADPAMAEDAVVGGQSPAPGTALHKGAGIGVSDAADFPEGDAVMPDLTGKTASEAVAALFEAGLNADYQGDVLGLASSQGAEPGALLPRWSKVAVGFTREVVE